MIHGGAPNTSVSTAEVSDPRCTLDAAGTDIARGEGFDSSTSINYGPIQVTQQRRACRVSRCLARVWVPETMHTARDLPVRPRQVVGMIR
jgi:hypothetical protein